MLVQSFVISNVIKGLLFSYVFILFQLGSDIILFFSQKRVQSVLTGLIKFISIYAAYQITVQFLNVIYEPDFSGLVLVSFEPSNVFFLRKSLITQSLYLGTCVIFFLYLRHCLEIPGNVERIIRVARAGVIIYVLYGFYEFFGFLFTGQNVDFLSNRITGEDNPIGYFQVVELGGMYLQRMKSLAGEPSMFAYSVLPFVILFYYRRDRIYIFFLIAVILSTATTGIVGLLCFIFLELLVFRKSLKFPLVLGGILAAASIVFYKVVAGFIGFTFEKFSMINLSSIDRFAKFADHFLFFAQSDLLHVIFGYGFGYVRSTDGLATLLVNVGLLGTGLFTLFLIYPMLRMKVNTDYRRGLAASILATLAMIFASVSEFYYLQIWFLAALSWHEYYLDLRGKNDSR